MTKRPDLVYLVHRIPYPPNKGDKIRSYNLLRFLREHYAVHLGTFVDDESDWAHVPVLKELCSDVCVLPLHPRRRRLRSLTAFVSGEPLSVPYYRSRRLARWVERKIHDEGVRRFVAFSAPMAQYAPDNGIPVRTVVDFVDVDSEKWRQYAEKHSWPMSWVYRREGGCLLEFERRIAEAASASVFVTADEAELFRRRTQSLGGSIFSIVNGVDTEYFSPDRPYERPWRGAGPVIVFTGMMDYWANVDAVSWFARESFPLVRDKIPEARFFVVGARPTRDVVRLEELSGVQVTGAVGDVRPYLAHASAAVGPMRIARGIQNKVLEAIAMARPVVATSAAVEGLELPGRLRENVLDEPSAMAARLVELLTRPSDIGRVGRQWILTYHAWSETLEPMRSLIESGELR